MKFEEFKFSNIILALPIIQISCASLFLSAYCFGFGASLYVFISTSDLFTASIGAVVPAYFLYLIFPGVMAWNSIQHLTAEDKIRAIPNEAVRNRYLFRLNNYRESFFVIIFIVILCTSIYQIYTVIYKDNLIELLLFMQCYAVAAALIYGNKDRLKLNRVSVELLVLVSLTVIGIGNLGIDEGRSDRHLSYAAAMSRKPHCGQFAIIRKMSNLYLVVTPGDQKAFVDEKCQIRVSIPVPRRSH